MKISGVIKGEVSKAMDVALVKHIGHWRFIVHLNGQLAPAEVLNAKFPFSVLNTHT